MTLTSVFPISTQNIGTITFNVGVADDQIVEAEEVFVVVLDVLEPGISVMRSCTLIRIQEHFSGQCKEKD